MKKMHYGYGMKSGATRTIRPPRRSLGGVSRGHGK